MVLGFPSVFLPFIRMNARAFKVSSFICPLDFGLIQFITLKKEKHIFILSPDDCSSFSASVKCHYLSIAT